MAYPQFGYPTAASSLASTQLLSMSAGSTPQTTVATSCCESGRPIMTDPQTGATVCSCQYSSSLLSYPRVASLSETVYGSAYATQGYVPFGTDPSAFYSPLNSAYDLKEGNDAWRSLAHPTPCYPYDPTGMAGGYPYGQSALAQRKNATREATSTLKAWLHEHIKNPYPTKGEKIMLAIITKMTLTQVSTWFANARRRLKKENKMTWSPRNRSDEDGNKLDSDDEDGDGDKDPNGNDQKDHKDHNKSKDDDRDSISNDDRDQDLNVCGDDGDDLKVDVDDHDLSDRLPKPLLPGLGLHQTGGGLGGSLRQQSSCMNASGTSKPRIWSIADVATSGNSPPGRGGSSPGSGGMAAHQHMATTAPPLHATQPTSHLLPPTGDLSQHHKLSPTDPTDSYRPLINGFRPWVNGTSGASGVSAGLGSGTGVGGLGGLGGLTGSVNIGYPGSISHHTTAGVSPLQAGGGGGQGTGGGIGPLSVGVPPSSANHLLQGHNSGLTSGLLRPYALAPRTEVH